PPLFRSRRQHPVRPDLRSDPVPAGPHRVHVTSPGGHCRRLCFLRYVRHGFLFLRAFAPPPLRGFVTTTRALTPARRLFGSREHAHRPSRAGLPASCATPSSPFRLHPPDGPHRRFGTLPVIDGGPGGPPRDFTFPTQAHRAHPAVSSSSSYGLVIHLRLLSTPSHDDAVTAGYRPGERLAWEDLHLSDVAPLQAHVGCLRRRQMREEAVGNERRRVCFCRRLSFPTASSRTAKLRLAPNPRGS